MKIERGCYFADLSGTLGHNYNLNFVVIRPTFSYYRNDSRNHQISNNLQYKCIAKSRVFICILDRSDHMLFYRNLATILYV